jgi:hypothetical protein
MITPPTFPARPVNGGPLPKAQPKYGEWTIEGKYNGWRAWVHNPTGAMFNRMNQPLSISHEFKPALAVLRELPWEWTDTEGLERRHNFGRGSLIILDYLAADPKQTLTVRKSHIHLCAGFLGIETHTQIDQLVANDRVYLPMSWRYETESARQLWDILQRCNAALACKPGSHFWEGFVAKRNDSIYPLQLRNPELDFPFWMKHRWAF